MGEIIYGDWLKIAPIIYFVLGSITLFTAPPKGRVYTNYITARRIFGVMLFMVGAYIGSLGIFDYRSDNLILAVSANVSIYFIAANLSAMMFHILLNVNASAKEWVSKIATRCSVVIILLALNYLIIPYQIQIYIVALFVLLLIAEVARVTIQFLKSYRRAQNNADEYYSESITPFVKWMKYSIYILIFVGFVGCTHAYYLPIVNTIYGIISIALLTYILISFHNYMMTLNEMYHAFDDNSAAETGVKGNATENQAIAPTEKVQPLHDPIQNWIEQRGFITAGITIESLARELNSNRTYVSAYIHNQYNTTYRDWISTLRIDYAKELLENNSSLFVWQVAEMVGYNRSSFTKAFIKENGVSPQTWREQRFSSTQKQ